MSAACLALSGCTAEPQKAASQSPARAEEAALPPEQFGGFDARQAFAHVEKLVAIGPRTPGSEGIRRAQQYIRSQLESFGFALKPQAEGCRVEEDDFHASTPRGRVPMKNIVAKIPGRGEKVVLLLTHYDTFPLADFVGANDGGSSTGLMLELARLLCLPRAELRGTPPTQPKAKASVGAPLAAPRFKFDVWIVFLDGEEAFVQWSDTDGTYGSRQLAARLAVSGELKRVQAVILADMIGDANLNLHREPNSTKWLTDLAWSAAARLGYNRYFLDQETGVEDDHTPFLRRSVPAVDLIDFDYPPWHTAADTLDKVSPRSLATVGHVILETLAELEKKLP